MKKHELISALSGKILSIRTESGYTQEEMAEVLGLSKKTLVQIEKGRQEASWATIVVLCTLFRDNAALHSAIGGDPLDVVQLVAHQKIHSRKEKTMGGKVWWRDIASSSKYKMQQNIISFHYRIIDHDDYRWFSSFDKDELDRKWAELTGDSPVKTRQ
ncbi:helix-turn-helix domain-containing protein [Metabacillus sp. JX24]|uniref:helix-turn-helix domain-containing protein n=1 Tax=Metabacillus sp. JX24 TaxID=3240759 RepID=UPI00350F03D7